MSSNDLNPDKVLIFDLMGPMAHFRKYYTNSSSLSYLFPPKTVIVGLIAGILGLPSEIHARGNEAPYYEKFSDGKCLIAISIKSKIRRMMQTVNYSATDNFPKTAYKLLVKMINGEIGHTQIPLEILCPENNIEIIYRIYFYHTDEKNIYNNLKKRLDQQMFVYPPYMGLTEFLASINYIGEGNISKNQGQEMKINTVCKLREVELDFGSDNLQYITEKMPTGFLNNRTPLPPEDYVLEVKGEIMNVKLKDNAICYSVSYFDNGCGITENVMFI